MIKRIMSLFKKPVLTPVVMEKPERPRQFQDYYGVNTSEHEKLEELWEANFKNSVHPSIVLDSKEKPTFAMDNQVNIKANWGANSILPPMQVLWYAQQTFIGYQLCAMLAQQWLIAKACLMPAKDATRNGFEISVNDGTKIKPEVLEAVKKADARYHLNKNLIELVQMGRVFGIRIALFNVRMDTDELQNEFYENPFNIDAVTPGSYQGISQIDPYWITPQLDNDAAGNPASMYFYEPTWWIINGKKVHRTHLVIYRTEEVADILKPTYIFGGIPIPQKIAQRVYASEKTADEAPMLAMTKRLDVVKIDLAKASMNPFKFVQRMLEFTERRDNYGVKTIDLEDEMQQFDTSLADLDAVIMTQYQLVAAAANVPAVKLLGTPPKGFNATGEFEEANYHEELESIQSHDLTPMIERHHLLLVRSEIAPDFGIAPFEIVIAWNELDAMTNKEQAEINKMNAEAGVMLVNAGAIDGEDERDRLRSDEKSGYMNLTDKIIEPADPFTESPLAGA